MCVRWASNEWSDFSQYRTVKLKIMISFEYVCVCVCLCLSLSLSVGQVQLCMKVSFVHIFSSLTDTAGCMRGAHISFPSLSLPLPPSLSLHTTEFGVWKLHIYLFQSVSVWHSGVCKLHMHLDLSVWRNWCVKVALVSCPICLCMAQSVCESCTCVLSYLCMAQLDMYLVLSLYCTVGVWKLLMYLVSVWHSWCVKVEHVSCPVSVLHSWCVKVVRVSCPVCLCMAQLVCESCTCNLSCLCMAQLVCENCTCILSCLSLCDTVGVWKFALVSCPVSVWHSWCVKAARVSCPVCMAQLVCEGCTCILSCLYGTVGVWKLYMCLALYGIFGV